jgi:hypothetical protein
MTIEAMKQALEALLEINELSKGENAICLPAEIDGAMDALRTAIEHTEKQEPRCAVIVEVFGKDWRLDYMSLPVGKHRLYTQQYVYTTAAQRERVVFPTMLRKMWSGREVQAWLDENVNKEKT